MFNSMHHRALWELCFSLFPSWANSSYSLNFSNSVFFFDVTKKFFTKYTFKSFFQTFGVLVRRKVTSITVCIRAIPSLTNNTSDNFIWPVRSAIEALLSTRNANSTFQMFVSFFFSVYLLLYKFLYYVIVLSAPFLSVFPIKTYFVYNNVYFY